MQYQGVIIEESLVDKSILGKVKIKSTKIEPITSEHKTPWLKQWTLHNVLIDEKAANEIAEEISKSFDYSHGSAWYADFKNNRSKLEEYRKATNYGISFGIPKYQADFASNVIVWKR